MIRAWTYFAGVIALGLLFAVDLCPGRGQWRTQWPHTQAMGPIRLALHNLLTDSLDEMEARVR